MVPGLRASRCVWAIGDMRNGSSTLNSSSLVRSGFARMRLRHDVLTRVGSMASISRRYFVTLAPLLPHSLARSDAVTPSHLPATRLSVIRCACGERGLGSGSGIFDCGNERAVFAGVEHGVVQCKLLKVESGYQIRYARQLSSYSSCGLSIRPSCLSPAEKRSLAFLSSSLTIITNTAHMIVSDK